MQFDGSKATLMGACAVVTAAAQQVALLVVSAGSYLGTSSPFSGLAWWEVLRMVVKRCNEGWGHCRESGWCHLQQGIFESFGIGDVWSSAWRWPGMDRLRLSWRRPGMDRLRLSWRRCHLTWPPLLDHEQSGLFGVWFYGFNEYIFFL